MVCFTASGVLHARWCASPPVVCFTPGGVLHPQWCVLPIAQNTTRDSECERERERFENREKRINKWLKKTQFSILLLSLHKLIIFTQRKYPSGFHLKPNICTWNIVLHPPPPPLPPVVCFTPSGVPFIQWGLSAHVSVHTKLSPSRVFLWIELGGEFLD